MSASDRTTTLNLHADILDVAERVDRLLHDAEHKDSAATFAKALMHDLSKADEFMTERDLLIAEALCIDPQRQCPAWEESNVR